MSKLSKSSLSIRKKWQREAVKRGGQNAKIVISQSQGMPIICNHLRNSFSPMNITSIYESLKAVVPPPLLQSCLDSMSVRNDYGRENNDSGNEDDVFVSTKKPKSKYLKLSYSKNSSSHQYSETVRVKLGRNGNMTLYYFNQNKLENEGNGLEVMERQKLVASEHNASEALKRVLHEIQNVRRESEALLSQPKNEDLNVFLNDKKNDVACIKEDLRGAEDFKENASHRKTLKRKLDKKASQWFQRKRKCLDFLDMMEENTEGIIRKKNCLEGKGQIEVESDEICVSLAKEFHARKRAKHRIAEGQSAEKKPELIGVLQGPRGSITRVTVD